MPQDYLDGVLAQINAIQFARKFVHNPNNIWKRAKIADMVREYGKLHPRERQPEIWSHINMRKWYLEGLRRVNEIPYFPYRST